MTQLAIYPKGETTPLFYAPITRSALIKRQLGGDYYIEIPFNHNKYISFKRGSFIRFNDSIFFLKRRVYPESLTEASGYKYTLRFYGRQHYMQDCRIKWTSDLGIEVTFDLTTTLYVFAQLLVDNMNSYLGGTTWRVGTIDVDNADITKHITFNGKTCWESAVEVAKAFGVEWWVDDVGGEVILNFGKCEDGDVEDFIEGGIISKMPASKRGDDTEYGTRFYIYGGTRNLPKDYYDSEQGGVTNHLSEKRLHLPDDTPYIDAWEDMDDADVVEQVIILDDVFPKNTETITGIATREVVTDGVVNTYYRIECANTAFKPSNLVSTLGAVFTSGSLQGREFDLQIVGPDNDLSFDNWFEILTQKDGGTGDSAISIPNEYLHPEEGDTFVLTGVKLPDVYVKQAEVELRNKGVDLVVQRSRDTNVYDCPTDPVFCQNNNKSFDIGQRVRLIGDAFGSNGRTSRIQGFEKKLYNEYEATYTIGDNDTYSRYSWLGKRIVAITETELKVSTALTSSDAKERWSNAQFQDELAIVETTAGQAVNTANQAKEGISAVGNEVGSLKTTITATQIMANKAQSNADRALTEVNNVSEDSNSKFEAVNTSITIINKDVDALESLIGDEYNIWFEPDTQIGGEPTLSNYPASEWTSDDDYFNHDKDLYYSITLGRAWRFMYNEGTPLWEEITDADTITALTKAQEALTKAQEALDGVSSLDFIKGVFSDDEILDENAAVLSRLVAVKDINNEVTAGIYGGGVDGLDSAGYKDSSHGTLMMFAGASGASNASNSKFRVYEDGSIFANSGVFGGVIKKGATIVTPDNILDFAIPVAGAFGNLVIDIVRIGSYIVFDGFQNTTWSEDYTSLSLPVYYGGDRPSISIGYSLDDLIGLIGVDLIFRATSDISSDLCFSVPRITVDGEISPVCVTIKEGDIIIATCTARRDSNDDLNIGWELNII